MAWLHVPALLFPTCVIWGKILYLFLSQLLICKMELIIEHAL